MSTIFAAYSAGLALVLTLAAGIAQANPIVIGTNGSALTCSATGVADPVCVGYTSTDALDIFPPTGISTSPTNASLFTDLNGADPGTPSDEGTEAAFLNALAGTSFSAGDLSKTEYSDPAPSTFSISSLFFILKPGKNWVFFRNETGGSIDIDLTTLSKQGLSHVTTAGNVSVVPLPGAVWLFGSGLLGLGVAAGRRRRKASAV